MTEDDMINIWLQYGLKSSPYFVNPLDPTTNSMYPISLFVGRKKVTSQTLNKIASNDNSRVVIEGVAGVGKTTFIHHIKHLASKKNPYLTFHDHIRVTRDYTSTQFVIDLIHSTLLALYRNFPDRINEFEKEEIIQKAKRLIMETKESQWGIGASLFGLGGSISKSKTHVLPIYQPQQFYSFLVALGNAVMKFSFRGIIFHINNIENLCLQTPDIARHFFNDIRDFLMVPGFHFLLGARLGFTDEILGKEERVKSIFQIPTILEPLDIEDTHQLLTKRYKHLIDEKNHLVLPVEKEVIEKYHQMFRGDLRSMFATISDAIELRGEQLEPTPLQYSLINPILQDKYEQYLRYKFTKPTWNLLKLLSNEKIPFRQSELTKERTELSQGRISQIFTELQIGGAINCVDKKGRSKFYDLSGISKIAFGKV